MKIGAEIPKDKVLPQLSEVLNVSVMRKNFQEALFPEQKRFFIQDCTIERVKYKPGKNCMVCYRLEISDVLTKQVDSQWVCARIFERGGAISRFRKAQSKSRTLPKFGKPLSHVPKLEMVVWAFPNDRKLHGLPKMTDSVYLENEILPEIINATLGPSWRITELSHDVVHYVPEHTCNVCVRLTLLNVQTNGRKSMTLFGKTYYNEEGCETYRSMRQLWESEDRTSGQLGMAQPLGYHPETKTLWQLGLAGSTLIDRDMNAPHFLTLLKEAATTVGALHRSSLSCSRAIHISDLLDRLQKVKQLLLAGWPACRQTLTPLVDRLICQSGHIGRPSVATLHGDLHLKNFFEDEGKIALIDMDNLYKGDPLIDIGSFIAGMLYRGLLMQASQDRIETISQAFIQSYEASVPWKVSRSTLRWYIATMLIIERAFRCLTRLKAGRLDILNRLVLLADRITLDKNANLLKREDHAEPATHKNISRATWPK